jgi:hypothetical protein
MGFLVEPRRLGARPKPPAGVWRQGCPATGRACRGASGPSGGAMGRLCTAAPADGLQAAAGNGGAPIWLARRTRPPPCSLPRWSASIRPPPGHQGGQGHSGPRAQPRRTDHHHTRRRRCPGPPDRLAPDAGPSACARRSGCGMARSAPQRPGRAGGDSRRGAGTRAGPAGRRRWAGRAPPQEQPQSAAWRRGGKVESQTPAGARLRHTQAVQRHCHPRRQKGQHIARRCLSCSRRDLA